MKDRIINLGKALVQELGLEPGVDTLSRWMAHYIAEQITIAENSTGDEKTKAEERCMETVLKIWERRSRLPDGRRPFENFEPIFRAIERFDPENSRPFYYAQSQMHLSAKNKASKSINNGVPKWIDIALGVDRAARVLIEFAFRQAATHAKDKKTKSWIENSADLQGVDELRIIIRLASEYKNGQDETARERFREDQRNYFKSRIEKLDAFSKFSSSLRTALVTELEKLSTDSPSADIDNIKHASRKSRSKKKTMPR